MGGGGGAILWETWNAYKYWIVKPQETILRKLCLWGRVIWERNGEKFVGICLQAEYPSTDEGSLYNGISGTEFCGMEEMRKHTKICEPCSGTPRICRAVEWCDVITILILGLARTGYVSVYIMLSAREESCSFMDVYVSFWSLTSILKLLGSCSNAGNVCVGKNVIIFQVNPLKLIFWIIYKDSVRTAKKTPHFTITTINWLTLFKEIIAVYSENHTKHINTLCEQNAGLLNATAGGTYGYHWVLKG
jgi:hypothetical protein